jgi:hypothetical protein
VAGSPCQSPLLAHRSLTSPPCRASRGPPADTPRRSPLLVDFPIPTASYCTAHALPAVARVTELVRSWHDGRGGLLTGWEPRHRWRQAWLLGCSVCKAEKKQGRRSGAERARVGDAAGRRLRFVRLLAALALLPDDHLIRVAARGEGGKGTGGQHDRWLLVTWQSATAAAAKSAGSQAPSAAIPAPLP